MPSSTFSLILTEEGDIYVCGKNHSGQLGLGDWRTRCHLEILRPPTKLNTVAAGPNHCLGVGQDGSLWAWGSNAKGQLGLGEQITQVPTLTQVPSCHNFLYVAAGWSFSLALDRDGNVWSFGSNSFGQLGLGDLTPRGVPTRIETIENATQITCGDFHALVLDSTGTICSFGRNGNGQLGNGTRSQATSPQRVQLENVRQIASGGVHNLALDSNSQVWSFGCGSVGQIAQTVVLAASPLKIEGLSDVTHVWCGGLCSYVSRTDGSVWVFGRNENEELGFDDFQNRDIPTENPALYGMQIIPGYTHAFGVDRSGELYCWGLNENGQLGFDPLSKSHQVIRKVENLRMYSRISRVKSAVSS